MVVDVVIISTAFAEREYEGYEAGERLSYSKSLSCDCPFTLRSAFVNVPSDIRG